MTLLTLGAVLFFGELIASSASAGISLPPLLTPRESHFAVLLDNNRILVFGGANADAGSSVEIYDPKRGSVRGAPTATTKSDYDYAVALDGGRVLWCGMPCAVYSDQQGQWQQHPLPGWITPLVPLGDGRILRAGGWWTMVSGSGTVLIDASTLATSLTGSMTTVRAYAVIVRLSGGRVLAAGGIELSPMPPFTFPLRSAEVFDPATGTWTKVSNMQHSAGRGLVGVALSNGTALINDEIYDPRQDRWSTVYGLDVPPGSAMTLLPNGNVTITGGLDLAGQALSTVTVFDPARNSIARRPGLQIPRARHTVTVLQDGSVLVIGGVTTGGVPTASVERITWEPRIAATLDKGFYVATSTARTGDDGGFAGIEVNTTAQMDGGLDFGGSLPAAGKDVGFAGFYLPEAQTVTGSVDFQPKGGGSFEVTLRLLDVNKQPEAAPITGGTHIDFQQALSAGFHVIELQTGERSPLASYQFALSAPHLAGGAVAGGVLDPAPGAPGFAAFYLPDRQDVTIRLYNENTYGSPRGAGEVILTLYDSSGKVIARSGPGTSP